MGEHVDDELFRTWLVGWSACRGYETHDDGRTYSVVLSDQGNQTEHFLFEPSTELFLEVAAETRKEPLRLLTVITSSPEHLLDAAGSLGMNVTDRQQSLMSVDMSGQDVEEPRTPGEEFMLERIMDGACRRVTVHAHGEVAARGSVCTVNEHAVYDRIVTEEDFRRRGLGTYVMRALTVVALEDDVTTGLLMASADGRALYEFLGWQHLADVFVIRG